MDSNKSRLSSGDKLAIALFCLGAVLALILFSVDKTPMSIALVLLGMTVLMVYPILHIFKSKIQRAVVFLFLLIGVVIFGSSVWPKNAAYSVAKQEEPKKEVPNPVLPQSTKIAKAKTSTKAKPAADSVPSPLPVLPSGTAAGGVSGGVSAGPCSVIQVGGSGNQAQGGQCGPPPLELSISKVKPLDPQSFGTMGGTAKYLQVLTISTNVDWSPVAFSIRCNVGISQLFITGTHFGFSQRGSGMPLHISWRSPSIPPEAPEDIYLYSIDPITSCLVTKE